MPRKEPFKIPENMRGVKYMINGSYPGPTIRANEHDMLELTIVNKLAGVLKAGPADASEANNVAASRQVKAWDASGVDTRGGGGASGSAAASWANS